MANSIDLIVSKQAQQGLDQLYESLKKTNEELLKASKTQLNFAGGSSPKNLQDFNIATQNYTKNQQQLTAVEKERLRVERALETTQARIATANDKNTQSLTQQRGVLKTLNSEYAKLSQKHNEAARTVQDLIARGKLASQTQAQYNNELKIAQDRFNALNSRVIQADTAVKRFNRDVGNYPQAAAQNIKSLLGAFGLVSGIYLFASAIKGAFTTIKDFDKANADLAATMGKTRSEITALTNDQKRLGASTKYTATEVAGLQKEFAKLGFSDKEILNSTEATLALASAVDTDLANAAMVAGATLRGFGLDASEMGRVVDVMAASFTKSALDVSNFQESMKYVAPIAAQTGVSIEFATAMLGKLADAGVKGSQAGTSLRRILTEMAKTGLPAAQAFDKVAKSGISVTDAMDEVGRTAQTALLVLSKSKDGINDLAKALENAGGAAQKMADEQLKSLEGQIYLMTSAWDGFILSINKGEGAIGSFLKLIVTEITEVIQMFDDFSKSFDSLKTKFNRSTEEGEAFYFKRIQEEADKSGISVQNLAKVRIESAIKQKDILKEEIDLLIKQNKEIREQYPNEVIRGLTGFQDVIESNNDKLEEKTIALGKVKAQLQAYNSILNPTKKGIEEVTEATNANTKATKKNAEVYEYMQTNSAAAFKKNISALEKQLDVTAKTSYEYGILEFQIKLLKSAYEAMYGEQKKVTELTYGTIPYYEEEIKLLREKQDLVTDPEQYAQLEKSVKFYEDLIKWIKGVKEETEDAKDATKEWLDEYKRGFVEQGFEGFDKILFLIDNFDKLKDSGVGTALAISEAFQQAFNTIAQASQANFDKEFERLEQQKEISILFAGESVTAKEEIERQYEERRRQIARRKAESEKKLAIFNAVIDTAQAVVAALPNYALAALVGVIGAAQIALISSQPIPAYATGGIHDGGLMLVNDAKGSNYEEVIETPDGKLSKPKGRNVVMNAPKGTKIHTPEQWDKRVNSMLLDVGINPIGNTPKIEIKNGITKDEMTQIMSKFANKDSVNVSIDEGGFKKMITRNGQKVNILNSRLRIKGRNV